MPDILSCNSELKYSRVMATISCPQDELWEECDALTDRGIILIGELLLIKLLSLSQ